MMNISLRRGIVDKILILQLMNQSYGYYIF